MNTENSLPLVSQNDCSPVPVFDCRIILSRPDENGRISARCANLNGMTVQGTSEREVLMAITRRFKKLVQEHSQARTEIPWINPPETPLEGEVERFIPVHL